MKTKSIIFSTALVLATSVGAVQAQEPFSTLKDVSAVKLASDQLAEVRGTNHVIRLVEFRSGRTLDVLSAEGIATTAAGSQSGGRSVGRAVDRPKIVAMLP